MSNKLTSKPLTVFGAIKAGVFTVTVVALFAFSIVSFFTTLWPWGCAIMFVLLSAFMSWAYYDITRPDEIESDELSGEEIYNLTERLKNMNRK